MFYRNGLASLTAAASGFITLLIAHKLAGDGDTFEVLQAVLDTQFWLATHVVCITFGYATTFLAGLLGILYIAARCRDTFAGSANEQRIREDDVRHAVLRHLLQLLRHGTGRTLGR